MSKLDYSKDIQKFNQISTPSLKAALSDPNAVYQRQLEAASSAMLIGAVGNDPQTYSGDVANVEFSNVTVKPFLPEWLYRPLYGRPRSLNIPEIRRLAKSPVAATCIKTIVDQVASVDWQIRMKDAEAEPDEAAIEEVTERLRNPNRNKEDLKIIIKKLVRDILEVEAGVLAKVFTRDSYMGANIYDALLPLGRREMVEFYAYDGGTFTINPNPHGLLPDQNAYFQYNFHQQSMPVPFARNEIVYMMSNPPTAEIYAVSPMEMCFDVVRYIVFGITSGIDHFTRNEIPPGVISVLDAETSHIKEFQARLADKSVIQDPQTEEARWVSSKVPVINSDIKFTPLTLTPEVMKLLESQQWYTKLILACFGVTPSELGWTEDSNKATELSQNEVFKRKTVLPMLDMLEYYFNAEIIPEYGYDFLVFEFVREDIQKELREQKLWEGYLKNGQMTVNEWREQRGNLDPVEWGDEPYKGGGMGGFGESNMFASDQEADLKSLANLKYKYLSRKRSGGRWVYEYPDDKKKKNQTQVEETDDLIDKLDDGVTDRFYIVQEVSKESGIDLVDAAGIVNDKLGDIEMSDDDWKNLNNEIANDIYDDDFNSLEKWQQRKVDDEADRLWNKRLVSEGGNLIKNPSK